MACNLQSLHWRQPRVGVLPKLNCASFKLFDLFRYIYTVLFSDLAYLQVHASVKHVLWYAWQTFGRTMQFIHVITRYLLSRPRTCEIDYRGPQSIMTKIQHSSSYSSLNNQKQHRHTPSNTPHVLLNINLCKNESTDSC